NVLLRPAVEAALLPTLAYAGGPAELKYLPDAAPLYETLGVKRQAPVPRWSGVLVEGRVEKLMERHGLDLAAFDGKPGELEARLVRDELPAETVATLAALRRGIALAPFSIRYGAALVDALEQEVARWAGAS